MYRLPWILRFEGDMVILKIERSGGRVLEGQSEVTLTFTW